MQLTGGKLKGKKLVTCKTKAIRPAMALVRKSIFDTLQNKLVGLNILDLCAGSGLVGIECLSREAGELTLIDSDKYSINLIRKNLSLCNLKAKVILGRLPQILKKKKLFPKTFDLIFLDPPYGKGSFITEVLSGIIENKINSSNCIIIIESESRSSFDIPKELTLYKEKRFGNTKLAFLLLNS